MTSKTRPALAALVCAAAFLSACAEPTGANDPSVATTDSFVREALDAYSVIQVAPAATPFVQPAPVNPAPIPAPATTARQTLSQFCQGRSGPQAGYIDPRTQRPIDCGPPPSAAPSV